MAKQPDFKETTSLQQYRGAIDFLQTHIQLLDVSLLKTSAFLRSQFDQKMNMNKALGVNPMAYDRLNHPSKQEHALIKHSQKKNIEFAIVDFGKSSPSISFQTDHLTECSAFLSPTYK